MKKLLFTNCGLSLVSLIVIFLTSLPVAQHFIIQAIVILLFLLLLIVNSFYIPLIRSYVWRKGKWVLFFLTTLLVQFIVVITGNWNSSYLILFHLTALSISLIFNFSTSVLFVAYSLCVITLVTFSDPAKLALLNEDPVRFALTIVTFLAVLPLTSVLSRQYKQKDLQSKFLAQEVRIEEGILSEIFELVFVTDENMNVLSMNTAAERTLHRSEAQLISRNLLEILTLKDKEGNVLNKDSFLPPTFLQQKDSIRLENLTFITTSSFPKSVSMQIKPLADLDGKTTQISYIISQGNENTKQISPSESKIIEEAQVKQVAHINDLKKKLTVKEMYDLRDQLILIAKINQDITYAQMIEGQMMKENNVLFDMAKMCKQLYEAELEIAHIFHTPVNFSILNFGPDDIAPLIPKDYPISPEYVTGPFFTASYDIKHVSFLIQKLLDIAVLICSSSGIQGVGVRLTIERGTKDDILIKVTTPCTQLTEQERDELFIPYYGNIGTKTHLFLGSGLEGYIVKTAAYALKIPLQVTSETTPSQLIFQIAFSKSTTTLERPR